MRGPATRESIQQEADEIRDELARFDAGDPAIVNQWKDYPSDMIKDIRGMVRFADEFAVMSLEQQQLEVDAINRMNRKSSSALVP